MSQGEVTAKARVITSLQEASEIQVILNVSAIVKYVHFYCASYALAVYAIAVCPSVCVSVCLSQVGVLLKWLNIGTVSYTHLTLPTNREV